MRGSMSMPDKMMMTVRLDHVMHMFGRNDRHHNHAESDSPAEESEAQGEHATSGGLPSASFPKRSSAAARRFRLRRIRRKRAHRGARHQLSPFGCADRRGDNHPII